MEMIESETDSFLKYFLINECGESLANSDLFFSFQRRKGISFILTVFFYFQASQFHWLSVSSSNFLCQTLCWQADGWLWCSGLQFQYSPGAIRWSFLVTLLTSVSELISVYSEYDQPPLKNSLQSIWVLSKMKNKCKVGFKKIIGILDSNPPWHKQTKIFCEVWISVKHQFSIGSCKMSFMIQ